jgi:hypothetical protein
VETVPPVAAVKTVFLHLKRLPLDNRGHSALHARFFAHDAMDLFWIAVAYGGDQHQISRQSQNAKRYQHDPTTLSPFSDDLTDKDKT